MGKIRTKTIGLSELEKKQKEETKTRREQKKKRQEEKIKAPGLKGGQKMKQVAVSDKELEKMESAKKIMEKTVSSDKKQKKKKAVKSRSKSYVQAKKLIEKGKTYNIKTAVSLLKKMPHFKFDETVELHFNVKDTEVKGEVKLPHSIGKEVRVAIIDDNLLTSIEKGKIAFDVLIAHPSFMPKLVKFAKILGPKGLMPNPKNGTLTDKPESALKKFKSGSLRFKTEAKLPIIHQAVGKMSLAEKDLMENIKAFISAVNPSKINSAFLKSTMSPSIKLDLKDF